jgi:hypothetical protein
MFISNNVFFVYVVLLWSWAKCLQSIRLHEKKQIVLRRV